MKFVNAQVARVRESVDGANLTAIITDLGQRLYKAILSRSPCHGALHRVRIDERRRFSMSFFVILRVLFSPHQPVHLQLDRRDAAPL